jgi:hypothetical protein
MIFSSTQPPTYPHPHPSYHTLTHPPTQLCHKYCKSLETNQLCIVSHSFTMVLTYFSATTESHAHPSLLMSLFQSTGTSICTHRRLYVFLLSSLLRETYVFVFPTTLTNRTILCSCYYPFITFENKSRVVES